MTPPLGTVAFLFTDIESSTRLWEDDPPDMARRVADHDRIINESVHRHDGTIFSSQGDSFAAAFHVVSDAVAAAVDAQRDLQEVLAVRMAVHVGQVESRDGGYFGPTLNRCGRLRDAAHGGQIICSQAVVDLLGAPPPGVEMLDLGVHRLRDLGRPERIHQATHPDLAGEFPPLNSLRVESTNLPIQVTSFIGRHQEMAEVDKLLRASRLVTLTGAGGCGKSRLAVEVAAELLDEHPDGAWLVELASFDTPDLAATGIASVLGVRERPNTTLVDALVAYLKTRHLLLVLDNCEHVLDALSPVVHAVITNAPDVSVLATSREPLHVQGEATYPVPPLPLPEPGDDAATIAHADAVRLFVERAAAVSPDFHLTAGNSATLASICRHLDGIPLAIELAAATSRLLPADQIEARLDDRFRLLRGASRDRLPHHRTLEAAIDWSFDHLNSDQQTLLKRLPVFVGGWTLAAAEAVCVGGAIDRLDVLPLLDDLVDRSLVSISADVSQVRYRLLETVHAYAASRDPMNVATLADAHARFYADFVERTSQLLETERQLEAVRLLEAEHPNLRAALDHLARTNRDQEFGELLDDAWFFLWLRRSYTELDRYLEHAAAVAGDLTDVGLRGRLLMAAGWTRTRALGLDLDEALPLLRESVVALRTARDDLNLSRALCYIAINEDASLFDEALEAAVRSDDSAAVARCHHYMGIEAFYQYDYESAIAHFDNAMEHWSSANHQAFAKTWKSASLYRQGDVEAASVLAQAALDVFEETGDLGGIMTTLETQTEIQFHLGLFEDALNSSLYRIELEATTFGREDGGSHAMAAHATARLGDERATLEHLQSIADAASNGLMDTDSRTHGFVAVALLALKRGHPAVAATALAAESTHRTLDRVFPASPRTNDIGDLVDHVRSALSPEEFDAAWQIGASLTLDDIIDFALESGPYQESLRDTTSG